MKTRVGMEGLSVLTKLKGKAKLQLRWRVPYRVVEVIADNFYNLSLGSKVYFTIPYHPVSFSVYLYPPLCMCVRICVLGSSRACVS